MNSKTRTLCNAAFDGNLDEVKSLLAQGADINAPDNSDLSPELWDDYSETPLILAIKRRHQEVAEYLIQQGADVNKPAPKGWTPLIDAVCNNDLTMVQILVESGADVNAIKEKERNGRDVFPAQTALSFAMPRNNEEIISFLLDRGARTYEALARLDDNNRGSLASRKGEQIVIANSASTPQKTL